MNWRGRILLWCAVGLSAAGNLLAQVTASTGPVADSFVRSAAPTSNFGNMGALAVSGTIATNGAGVQQGAYDSFLRFNISSLASTFNTTYGAGNWTIASARLNLTEVAAPLNDIFNRGVGPFEIRWIANDSWTETGITWNSAPGVLSSGQSALGTFSNTGTDGLETFSLALPASFVSDLLAGGTVSLYMTATANSTVGFTFNARNFGTDSARPMLELTAVPEPSTISLLAFSVVALALVRRRTLS